MNTFCKSGKMLLSVVKPKFKEVKGVKGWKKI